MPAIVEQRQKTGVQTAQRPDGKNDVQQQQRRGAEAANEQRFRGCIRMRDEANRDEKRQVNDYACNQHGVINFLLPIPRYGLIAQAHFAIPSPINLLVGSVIAAMIF